jgi:DNA-binding NarL/FixJ family response regulator
MGFVPKSENAAMIEAALRAALAGGVFLPSSLLGRNSILDGAHAPVRKTIPTSADMVLGVTKRQGDVLRLLVQGLPNKRIAAKLDISVPVVKKHVSDLLAHFQVVSRTQLVAHIAERGIFFGPPELSDPKDELMPGEE